VTTVDAAAVAPPPKAPAPGSKSSALLPRLLIAPAVAVVAAMAIYPSIWSLWVSLHDWFPAQGTGQRWVGLKNYGDVLSSGRFWHSMKNLALVVVVGVGVEMILGIALALALVEFVRRAWQRVVLLTFFLLPMMLAPAVVGDIWRFMFQRAGVLNYLLDLVGLPQQNWTSAGLGIWSVIVSDIWQWTALPMLIVFAGRSAMPDSLFEAARLDGASWWFRTTRITLPMLRELIIIALLLRAMDSYKLIDSLFIITNRGGPGTSNEVTGLMAYTTAFVDFDVGTAATITWLLGVIALVLMRLFWIAFRSRA
jgi:multiple sugar transport system permease protein